MSQNNPRPWDSGKAVLYPIKGPPAFWMNRGLFDGFFQKPFTPAYETADRVLQNIYEIGRASGNLLRLLDTAPFPPPAKDIYTELQERQRGLVIELFGNPLPSLQERTLATLAMEMPTLVEDEQPLDFVLSGTGKRAEF